MNKFRSIRFNCDRELLCELDSYRSRYVSRTQMLEVALSRYLADLKQGRVRISPEGWLV